MANGVLAAKEELIVIPRNERREIIKTTDRMVAQSMKSAVDKMRLDVYDSCSTVSARMTIYKVSRIAEEFEKGTFMSFIRAWDNYQDALDIAKKDPAKKACAKYYDALDRLEKGFSSVVNDYSDRKARLMLGWPNVVVDAADYTGYALIPLSLGLGTAIGKGLAKASKKVLVDFAEKRISKSVATKLVKSEITKSVNLAFNSYFAVYLAGNLGAKVAEEKFAKPSAARQAIDMSSFASMVMNDKGGKSMLYESLKQLGAVEPGAFEKEMEKIANPPLDIGEQMGSIGMQIAILALVNRNAALRGLKRMLQKSGVMAPETVAKLRYAGL
jgi:hypothetical protein